MEWVFWDTEVRERNRDLRDMASPDSQLHRRDSESRAEATEGA